MSTKNQLVKAKSAKEERQQKVLLGLVDLYLKEGTPIGSSTLKETGFEDLSSATIRNYFATLEEEGYLEQQHASGGRIPTEKAFRIYADTHRNDPVNIPKELQEKLGLISQKDTKEIATLLQESAEIFSDLSQLVVCLSAPRFDHDFILDVKMLEIDSTRYLCVLITDFGVIKTELISSKKRLSSHTLKRIERYFHWRFTGNDKPEMTDPEEEWFAKKCYNEVMMRYIVGYAHFSDEEVYSTGLSTLLHCPEFSSATDVAQALSLVENRTSLRHLLRDCTAHNRLSYWIGSDLDPFAKGSASCAFIACPYRINDRCVGAVGLLGPMRIPYPKLFGLMRSYCEALGAAITKNVYKYKISYRQTQSPPLAIELKETMLIEDKTKE